MFNKFIPIFDNSYNYEMLANKYVNVMMVSSVEILNDVTLAFEFNNNRYVVIYKDEETMQEVLNCFDIEQEEFGVKELFLDIKDDLKSYIRKKVN